MLDRFAGQHVLLLQGPLGPFFRRFAVDLSKFVSSVTKINFNAGDEIFFPGSDCIAYRDTIENWPNFVRSVLVERKIDTIFLLGDCRPYHLLAKKVARELDVDLFVFEEGYLRPDFFTLEYLGVNGNSLMSKDPSFYKRENFSPRDDVVPVGNTFWHSALFAAMYYCALTAGRMAYPNYVHYREQNLLYHIGAWVRGGFRKVKFRLKEKGILENLITRKYKKFFLFPLQVHNDFQFTHSKYENVEDCIEEVVQSFAVHANQDEVLVFKHHPADRPYRDYSLYFRVLTLKYHLRNRLLYVHDLHLPTLLKNAKGTVVMNSTVGLSSIHHQTPVKVMGKAIYNVPGLTSELSLDEFWQKPGEVDFQLYQAFRGWLEHNNQVNGNFYRLIKRTDHVPGLKWVLND